VIKTIWEKCSTANHMRANNIGVDYFETALRPSKKKIFDETKEK